MAAKRGKDGGGRAIQATEKLSVCISARLQPFCIRARLQSCRKCAKINEASAPGAWLPAPDWTFSAACLAALLAGLTMLAPGAAMAQQAPPATPATAQTDGTTQPPVVPTDKTDAANPADPDGPALSATSHAGSEPTARRKRNAEKFYLRGVRAMDKGDVAAAEKAFAQAAKENPANPEYENDREIARQHRITELIQNADKARILGDPQIAKAKLEEALALDPKNPEVAQHAGDLAGLSSTNSPDDDATATIAPPIELAPTAGRQSFHMRNSKKEILRAVLSAYGLYPVFDNPQPGKTIRFDADDVDFAQAEKLLNLATDSFLVPLDPKRVLVADDTRSNRTEFERQDYETLRLPGLTPAELTDMGNIARNVLGVAKASVQQESATLTVSAPRPTLVALNRTFADLLDGRSEVLLDVRLYQVAKTRTRNIGVQLPQTLTLFNVPSELNNIIQQNQGLVQQIISSGLASPGDFAAIAAILIASGQVTGSVLGQPFALFGGGLTESGLVVPGVTGNLTLNSAETRALDDVQLRLEDKEEGTVRSGTRYPITTSSYSSIAGSSLNIPGLTSAGLSSSLAGLGVNLNNLSTAQAIPQVQYQDLGLTLTVTPNVQHTGNVALKLNFKLTALQGTSLNGLPILTNQSYEADVTVGSGASALLVSEMTRSQSKAVSGAPGLSDLPGFQSATNSLANVDTSELVILITPHLLRRRHSERVGPYIPLPRHGL